eukprot:7180485-Alexandrium_andersonii.AAC.1
MLGHSLEGLTRPSAEAPKLQSQVPPRRASGASGASSAPRVGGGSGIRWFRTLKPNQHWTSGQMDVETPTLLQPSTLDYSANVNRGFKGSNER